MTKRMLIDGAHPEETRVVIVDGNQLEDFDYESTSRKTLKGNIYLGKVTRVEPSLQACFVEYGGNRHGFLPFGEIHPDYYRIPMADREALKAAEAAALEAAEAREEQRARAAARDESGEGEGEAEAGEIGENGDDAENAGEPVEAVGGDDTEDHRRRVARLRRNYTIQEVIKRRQIVLVQVVKEERGTKGAALTTYISLAGRYCVLMPNTTSGGGISRKITNVKDRKRLKEIVDDLNVPSGMAVILRTAGLERTKAEIKRDYEFLVKVWDDIAARTLESRAPTLIHEEANLIKRTIRDSYTRDVEEILVDGEDAYRTAKTFMRALMPSHAKRVQLYKEGPTPLFTRYGVESQLDALHSPTVRLPSGGYIVINTTEALVAIDVNSGRATRERGIEETALKTNQEAASAIARQLRLRDLAGLIVIDFIDMEDRRNNAAVERRLKDAMKLDRARLQIGRISGFGLLELSRQRLRPSLFESSTHVCPTCGGTGHVRSIESSGLHVLRAIEEEAVSGRYAEVSVHVATPVALYLLNQKRDALNRIARDHGMVVWVEADDALLPPAHRLTGLREKTPAEVEEIEESRAARPALPAPEPADLDEDEVEEAVEARAEVAREDGAETTAEDEAASRRRRGRRGGRRRGRRAEDEGARPDEAGAAEEGEQPAPEPAEAAPEPAEAEAGHAEGAEDGAGGERPRRRRRRGGRGRRSEMPADLAAIPEGAPEAMEAAPGGIAVESVARAPAGEAAAGSEDAPAAEAAPEAPALEAPAPEAPAPEEVAAPEASAPASAAVEPARAEYEPARAEYQTAEPETAEPEAAEAGPAEPAEAEAEPDLTAPEPVAPEAAAAETVVPETVVPETMAPETPETVVPEPEPSEPLTAAETAEGTPRNGMAQPEPESRAEPESQAEPESRAEPEPQPEEEPREKRRGWWQRLVS